MNPTYLWEAANILRGPVDAADFKSYVFPLLFFKRLSGVHDEGHRQALRELDGDEEAALFPENYRFQIPEDSHWQNVRKVATNVQQALRRALLRYKLHTDQELFDKAYGDIWQYY